MNWRVKDYFLERLKMMVKFVFLAVAGLTIFFSLSCDGGEISSWSFFSNFYTKKRKEFYELTLFLWIFFLWNYVYRNLNGVINYYVSGTITCANVRCGFNTTCVDCEPNECNTYTCENPNGKGKVCTDICKNPGPRCICRPEFYKEPGGRCVPLKCNKPPPNTSQP